jgi:hypothetical protein
MAAEEKQAEHVIVAGPPSTLALGTPQMDEFCCTRLMLIDCACSALVQRAGDWAHKADMLCYEGYMGI